MSTSKPVVTVVFAASSDARQLWSIVALLAAVGIGLAALAVAVFKSTRPDRELLAPLEVMGSRKWRRSDPVWQHRQLDDARPPGAQPLTTARALPEPLAEFDQVPGAPGFDDLRPDALAEPEPDAEADDAGIGDALTELPGGVLFDSDPTPPSREVPVLVAEAPPELTLADLASWSAPTPEDRTADGPAAVQRVDELGSPDEADGLGDSNARGEGGDRDNSDSGDEVG